MTNYGVYKAQKSRTLSTKTAKKARPGAILDCKDAGSLKASIDTAAAQIESLTGMMTSPMPRTC